MLHEIRYIQSDFLPSTNNLLLRIIRLITLKQFIDKPTTNVEWNPTLEAWTIARYADVAFVLNSPKFSAAAASETIDQEAVPDFTDPTAAKDQVIKGMHQQMDWIRKLMVKTGQQFCKKQNLANFDLQQDLIFPWCKEVALQASSMADDRQTQKKMLANAQTVFMMTDGNNREAAEAATGKLAGCFYQIIEQRRQLPQADLISSFIDKSRSTGELLSPVIQLFVGLSTSLPLLLGNLMLELLSSAENQAIYLRNPRETAQELLRMSGPTQYVYRVAKSEVTMAGKTFSRGDRLALFLVHANRDDVQFANGRQLDLERKSVAHLSFGLGAHACLGAPIIREACLLLPKLIFEYFPSLQLHSPEIVWGGSRAIRGVTNLQVKK